MSKDRSGPTSLISTASALGVSLIVFGIFLLIIGANPIDVFGYMIEGSVGSLFSIQNTILMASPLLLVAFCTALPASLGMGVIGNEGALVIGGLVTAATGVAMTDASYWTTMAAMFAVAFTTGGLWIGSIGYLKHYLGVNETIAGLLLNYIAIAIMNHLVEGVLRDPESLNKPSTFHIGMDKMIASIPGTDLHYGMIIGPVMALLMFFLYRVTTFGFAVRIIGGNKNTARLAGLNIGRITLITFFLAGGISALAGMVEVTAIHGRANMSLVVGYGYTGILVSFLARHNPLYIIPTALLFGALNASSGLIQRRCELPDATMVVLQGIIFVTIIAWDAVRSRSWTIKDLSLFPR